MCIKRVCIAFAWGYEISERALDNIQREYALLKSVDNQDIVKAFDLFVEGGRAYLVMERILGANMRTLVFETILISQMWCHLLFKCPTFLLIFTVECHQ